MAYDLILDAESWDLAIDNGDFIMADGATRIAQQILITLKFWLGEWFLDTSEGIPYFEEILVKNPNLAHVRQIFTEKISEIEGVNSIDLLELDYDAKSRTLAVEYEIGTDYGLIRQREVL